MKQTNLQRPLPMTKSGNTKDFQLETSIGFLVNRLAFVLRQKMTARLKKAGLDITPEECVLLNKLWQKDGQMQNELSQATIKDQTTVTRIIDKMEKKGLVIRKHDKKDRRRVMAHLTSAGKKKRNQVLPLIQEMLGRVTGCVSSRELEITKMSLGKMINGLLENDLQ